MLNFFVNLIKPNNNYALVKKIAKLLYLWITTENKEMLEEWFELMINDFLKDIPYEWIDRNPEWWFKTFLWIFLSLNNVCYYPEVQNLVWRKDLVIPMNNKYYIVEAKVNESTKKAIEQIDKKYVPQLKDGKEIVKYGLNWDRKWKNVVEIEIVNSE